MNPDEFERILSIGLGRAILHLQSHDARPYRDAILHACLHNTSYDQQIEGDRAKYMLDVIALTSEADFYHDEILGALRRNSENSDVSQLLHFAALFAARGDAEARQLLYEHCARTLRTDQDRDAVRRIVELDGIDGLLFVLREIENHRNPPEDLDDDYTLLFSILEERDGEERARSSLEEMASQDSWIAAYLRAIDAFWQTEPMNRARVIAGHGRIDPDEATYEQLLPILHDARLVVRRDVLPFTFWRRWGHKASDADIDQAAQDFLQETYRDRLLRYLYMFDRRRFPKDPSRILGLATDPDEDISRAALHALEPISDPDVRRFPLVLLDSATGLRLVWAIRLLQNNYQAGDHLLIENVLRDHPDDEEFHGLGFAARKVIEAHPTQDAASALLFVYECGPCSLCREHVVRLLHQLGRLPTEIIAECRWDSNFDLREMGRAW